MNSPLVTIAIATFNGERFLVEQLDSILQQSYKNIEIIICDDISTDTTMSIIENFKDKNYQIKLYKNENQLGFVKNFEKAILLATGEYIALADQDDIWLPSKLVTLVNEIMKLERLNPNIPLLVHSDATVVDENLSKISEHYIGKIGLEYGLKNLLFGRSKVQGAASIINKKMVDIALPFPEGIPFHDLYFSLISDSIGKRLFLEKNLFYYRKHLKSITEYKGKQNVSTKVDKFLSREFYFIDKKEFDTVIAFNHKFAASLNKSDRRVVDAYLCISEGNFNVFKSLILILKFGFKGNSGKITLLIKFFLSRV